MTDYIHHHWEIGSEQKVYNLQLKRTWEYRDLMWLMVRRDFVSLYKQTILGPLWFIIQPILTTVIYTIIFGNIAGISTDGLPRPLFYMAGITAWNYFMDCFSKNSGVFRDNAGIFGKVYFPRLVVPFSIVISNMIRFAIQLLLFLTFMAYYVIKGTVIHPNIYLFLFPVLVVQMALLGVGCGMIISGLSTKYRDLSFLIGFGMQLWMYATPIIYPLSAAPEKYKWFIMVNPMTAIVETFRYSFFGTGSFDWTLFVYSIVATIILLLTGLIVFTRVEKNFIDTV